MFSGWDKDRILNQLFEIDTKVSELTDLFSSDLKSLSAIILFGDCNYKEIDRSDLRMRWIGTYVPAFRVVRSAD